MKITTSNFLRCVILAFAVAGMASCKKDNDPEPEPTIQGPGVFVVNEGAFQVGNSSLSYYQFSNASVISDVFAGFNSGSQLGDTGQDVEVYGSKVYITVNGSNKVEVLDLKTEKILKTIVLTAATEAPAFPRYLAAANGKMFVSAYNDNVYVIDTASLSVTKKIAVGKDPEHMAVVGSKLYVANSGGLDYPATENTVSVIDLNTLTELKKITVGVNSNEVVADRYGDVYVTSRGNYADLTANLYRINTTTDQAIAMNIPATGVAIYGDTAYLYQYTYSYATDSYTKVFSTLNVNTEVAGPSFIKDDTDITSPYSIAVDPSSGNVYVSDAGNFVSEGSVYCYDTTGKRKFSFKAGVNPGQMAFYVK